MVRISIAFWAVLLPLSLLLFAPGCSQSTIPVANEIAAEHPTDTRQDSDVSTTQQTTSEANLRMLAWNVELDGGASSTVISEQLKAFDGYDIIVLSETTPDTLADISTATRHEAKMASSGRGIRLTILWDADRFSMEEYQELDQLNDDEMKHRSPMAVLFKDKQSNHTFYVVAVHLARGREQLRQRQATGIREWARQKSQAVIAIGDFNFDYVFADERGNKAFDNFMQDGVMRWVKPDKLVDTNWYDPESDGLDNYPGSMLDFAFVAGPAKDWSPVCNVIVRDGDFPDDKTTSDHRPIELLLSPR